MPIRVERRPDLNLTIFDVDGEITLDEHLALLADFYEHGPTENVIWDFTRVSGPRYSAADTREVIDLIQRYSGKRARGRTAIIGQTDLDFGMARMGALLGEAKGLPWQLEAFRNRLEALAWLTGRSDAGEVGV